MKTIIIPISRVFILSVLFIFYSNQSLEAKPSLPPQPQDQVRLTAIHDAGCRGDHSIIPTIITVLRHPSPVPEDVGTSYQIDPLYTHTALRAASQLRATEALPQIEALINSKDPDASAFGRVIKARILAEVAAQNVKDSSIQAAIRINRFFSALGITSADINSDLSSYNKPLVDSKGRETIYTGWQPPVPVGVYAMREIADMVYQADYRDYVSLPAVAALHLNSDGPSMIKRRFARPLKTDRIAALIEDLSRRDPHEQYDAQEAYIMQLAIDEGQAAAQVAIAKLQLMEAHPDQYPVHGFYNLIDLVGYAGGKTQGARFEKLHDPRRMVATRYLWAAQDITNGRHKIFVPGY